MAINGLNSGTNDIYGSIFGTSNNNSTGGTFSLGDQYMIRNGTYKKLMKAYYATDETEGESGDSTEKEADSKTSLLGVKANAASLNNSLEDLKKTSLFEANGEDEEGNKVEYDDYYWINNEEIKLDPLSQEQVDELVAFIQTVNKRYYTNTEIINIINEEMEAYFSGQKTADAVAGIIQSRAQIYVDENR